ncbi:MAG: hypothetical protein WCJ49_06275 [Deltaproteobacteria bacterium]
MIFAKVLLIWLFMLMTAVALGTARVLLLVPHIGDYAGHIVNTVIVCIMFFFLIKLSLIWLAPKSRRQAWLVGLLWFFLTICFEFLGGHYLFSSPWETLLADYNIFQGRIWALVLLTLLFAPQWIWQQRQV